MTTSAPSARTGSTARWTVDRRNNAAAASSAPAYTITRCPAREPLPATGAHVNDSRAHRARRPSDRRPRGLDLGAHLPVKALGVERTCVARAHARIHGAVVERQDRARQFLGSSRPEATRDAVDDRLERAAAAARDHRSAGGLA